MGDRREVGRAGNGGAKLAARRNPHTRGLAAEAEQAALGVADDLDLGRFAGDAQRGERVGDRLVDRFSLGFDRCLTLCRHVSSPFGHFAWRVNSICCAMVRMLFTNQ